MARSPVPGFNATFDAGFADLVDQQNLVSKANPMIRLQPSSLNLSQNCWVTYDLMSISRTPNIQDEPTVVLVVSNDLQAISPQSFSVNASDMDYMAYWSSLQQLAATTQILDTA